MHVIQPMTEDQAAIRDAVAKTLEPFDDAYWLKTDETGEWPEEFCAAMAKGDREGAEAIKAAIDAGRQAVSAEWPSLKMFLGV